MREFEKYYVLQLPLLFLSINMRNYVDSVSGQLNPVVRMFREGPHYKNGRVFSKRAGPHDFYIPGTWQTMCGT